MVLSVLTILGASYALGAIYGRVGRTLASSPYPSPEEAQRETDLLAERYPQRMAREIIGASTQGRPIVAYRIHGDDAVAGSGPRPRLLVTAHIHAVEYIGSYVARGVMRQLVEGYGGVPAVTRLLDRGDVWVVPLLNPDGAARVWEKHGWSGLGGSRFTANGVDPNRNFPFVAMAGRGAWNSGRDKPGSAYYRGPDPLSEPECLALARLAQRERFCGAINFHSFGGVVFLPAVVGGESDKAKRALDVFKGQFQSQQRFLRYRPVPERSASIVGQLDPFLLNAFGTPSVTVEVSRPGLHLLLPWNTFNVFWWANPADPERWLQNDAPAAVHAMSELLDATAGVPCPAATPELAQRVGDV